MNIKILIPGFLAIVLMLSSCQKNDEKPNVIFILVDDLGWKDIQNYGSDYHQTPNIDALANAGVKFTNAYTTSSVCSPTRASILTGKYPARLHLTDYIPGKPFPKAKLLSPNWQKYLDTSEITIAERFQENGYKTVHIGKWHLGKDTIYWPENQGFDINIGGWSRGAPLKNKRKGTNGYFSPYGNPKLKAKQENEFLTQRLTQEAVAFIQENKDAPFFLNFWFYSVHMPLQAKKDKVDKYDKLLNTNKKHKNPVYAAMVEHVDDAVGQILTTLKKLNLDKNTIVVFTSDNGGLVGNHSRFQEKITSNFPLRSGKGDIYEGGIKVPCIIYYPNQLKSRVENTPIIATDFYPTLVEMANLNKNSKNSVDGVSLATLLSKRKPLEKRSLFWHYPHYHLEGAVPYSAIRFEDYKLIHNLETDRLELYDLKNDVGEKENLSLQNPSLTKELLQKLKQWKASTKAQEPIINPLYTK